MKLRSSSYVYRGKEGKKILGNKKIGLEIQCTPFSKRIHARALQLVILTAGFGSSLFETP